MAEVLRTDYTDEYKLAARTVWYSMGRPNNMNEIIDALELNQDGKKPSKRSLEMWRKDQDWDWWADELDNKAIVAVEENLIQRKRDMLINHADKAHALFEQSHDFMQEHGFTKMNDAINAFFKAAELERISLGMGEMWERMTKMDDGQLKDEIMKYLKRAEENNQFVDADVISKEKEEKDE